MVEKKAKTLMERFGFKDEDLTTKEHDEMLLWLNKNYEKIIGYTLNYEKFSIWDKQNRTYIREKDEKSKIFELLRERINRIYFKGYLQQKIEFPILSKGYIIGFVDFCLIPRMDPNFFHFENFEFNIDNSPYAQELNKPIYFEIKPKINSIGELIRQINMYRAYLPENCQFYVVTKTKGVSSILAQQRIFTHEYDENQCLDQTQNG